MRFPFKTLFSVLASAALCVPVVAGEPGGVLRFVGAGASTAGYDASEQGVIAQVGHHAAACGCETYPACGCDVSPAPACGCEPTCAAAPSCGGACYGHKRHFPILHMLGLDGCHHGNSCCSTPSCCEEPACGCEVVEAACGCEPTCEAPACAAPACGCEPTCEAPVACASSCSGHRHCGHRRSLLDVLFHCHRGCGHASSCCEAPSCCEEPACGCEVEAACGCEPTCAAAPTCASSCSGGYSRHCCHRPLLSLLGWHRCGCRSDSGCCTQVACAAPACGVEPACGVPYAEPNCAAPYAEPAMPVLAPMPAPVVEPAPAIDDVPPPASPSDMPAGGADVSSRSKWYSLQ